MASKALKQNSDVPSHIKSHSENGKMVYNCFLIQIHFNLTLAQISINGCQNTPLSIFSYVG
jgi:hypothetical protein